MSNRYVPLPSSRPDRRTQQEMDVEMAAAFDYSDDEDDDNAATESRPLNPISTLPPTPRSTQTHVPGTYDFENVDYDYPPPGSPPRPSATALPNDHGNSNGLIPSFELNSTPGPRHMWFQRAAAAVLPSHYVRRLGISIPPPSGPIGGGTNNDGVFANVTAKPSRSIRVQDGDSSFIVPEDSRQEAPPSYASAQADAVPPYWETTIHAPFSPDSIGEMIIDSLPTGSIFSFCWNMLVSVSFQFVGFLLTYLLHSTHAARLGSRAGLGVTLIQYGFALRGKLDSVEDSTDETYSSWFSWKSDSPPPSFGSPAEADDWYRQHAQPSNSTLSMSEEQASMLVADATTEWLSFFLMTVGWFILLTSILGFWRVKRWERGILASRRNANPASEISTNGSVVSQIERSLGLGGIARLDLIRQGFGFGRRSRENDDAVVHTPRVEQSEVAASDAQETDAMLPTESNDTHVRAAMEQERTLRTALRESSFL